MGPEQYRFIEWTQIVTGVGLGLIGIALAAFAPGFAPWVLPSLGVLWALGALLVARRLALVGARSAFVRLAALVIGLACVIRLVYIASHAA